MRCLAVSVDKVHRLGKQTIVPEVDRTGVGWQRSSVEERREHATILCVPPAGRLVRLLHRRIRLSGRQIELIVHENFQPESSDEPLPTFSPSAGAVFWALIVFR